MRHLLLILPIAVPALIGVSMSHATAQAQPAAERDKTAEPNGELLKSRGPMPPPWMLPHCFELIQQTRYEQARQLLAPIVADHPGWAKAHFYLGLTYNKEHRHEHARELFKRALELDPQYHMVRIYCGWSSYLLGRLDESRQMFESYLAVDPDYADAVFALGLLDFDDDNLPSARRRYLRAIELAKSGKDARTEAKARARLADVYIRTGDLQAAKRELDRSIQLKPDNEEPYFKLSRVLQRLGDADGAGAARQKLEELRRRVEPTRGPSQRLPGK